MIEAVNIEKKFGEVTVLDSLSLKVEEEEFVAILGESGSGKTTLLRVIAGLESMDGGQLFLHGRKPEPNPMKRGVSMTFQEPALWNHMTVRDNILYGYPQRDRDRRRKKAEELSEYLGIADLLRRYPYEISGGQAKRVALARALACEKSILLLDEPFSNLDEKIRIMAMETVKKYCQGRMTVLLVTHRKEEADYLCTRQYHMETGKLYG